jgi:hypothetical protein
MSLRWKYVAAALAPVLAAGTMFAVVLLPALDDKPVTERLLACSSPDEFEEADPVAKVAREDCFAEVLIDAVSAGKVQEIVPVMARYEANQMGLCHRAAHRAGGANWPADGRWILKIHEVNFGVCSSGLLHGFVDQVIGKEFSQDQWKQLMGWCDTQYKAGIEVACGDAVGHVAWTDTEDPAAAREICSMFATPVLRAECAEGVVMQQYSPASSSKEQKRLPADPLPVCAIHPAGGAFDAVRAGCIRGVGYAAVQQETFGLRTPDLAGTVAKMVGVCDAFEEQYRATCADRAYDMVRSKFHTGEFIDAADTVCLPNVRYYQTCIDRVLWLVPEGELGKYTGKITPRDLLGQRLMESFERT